MLRFIFLLFCTLSLLISNASAAINYTVTPINYELNLEPGQSATFPASIRNNGPDTVTLPTTASDFQANGTNGVPSVVRKSELVYPDQELSTWITLSASEVTLAPGQEKTIDFTIDVPANATPGGHYGAVLFRNPGSETSTSGNIGINVDYGIIILVNVAGEIIVDVDITPPIISGGGGGGGGGGSSSSGSSGSLTNEPSDDSWYIGDDTDGNPLYENPDECPFGDLTPSRFDGKCFGTVDTSDQDEEIANLDSNQNFGIDFDIPVSNNGNSHVKPQGQIILTNEAGETLKSVGKKIITNTAGAIIGEEVVDYIPINDQGGNVLPKTQRIFNSEWKGFPEKTFDDSGNQVIEYKNPGEYYTDQNKQDAGFLMFWERVCEVRTKEIITANIEMEYLDENGDPIIFSSAQEFPVQYIEQQVQLNPYIILAMTLLFIAFLLLWWIVRWWFVAVKTSKCWNCKEKIKSHWDTCPYCKKIQNKKKQRKFEKQFQTASSEPVVNTKKKKK
ncbi:DUF916 domain-containing protein [Candidatus Gracilibacteria bacterium]|nr:DUF916 domain-containing protein [Candidatus Gracilibacteria bacterium]